MHLPSLHGSASVNDIFSYNENHRLSIPSMGTLTSATHVRVFRVCTNEVIASVSPTEHFALAKIERSEAAVVQKV